MQRHKFFKFLSATLIGGLTLFAILIAGFILLSAGFAALMLWGPPWLVNLPGYRLALEVWLVILLTVGG